MNKMTMVMALAVTLAVSLIGVPSSMADEVERIDPSKEKELVSPEKDEVDTERVTLTIKNTLDSGISIHWLDHYDGTRVYYDDIEPGKELDRSTFPGHYWVIVDSGDKALGIYKTPDEAATITVKADELARIDPSKEKDLYSPEDTTRVTLTIKNTLDSAISIYWLDYYGDRVHYHDIKPGQELDRSTFPGHYWVIVDSDDKALGIYKTPDEAATITVKADELARIDPSKEKDLYSPEDTTRVTLTIKNTLDSAISIYWLDYYGDRVHYHDIEPGQELDRSTFPGHYWVIVDSGDKALGIYKTPDEAATIRVKADELARIAPSKEKGLKSPEDGAEVVLTIKNTRNSAITTYWIDYDGDRVQYQDVGAEKEAEQITFFGHYWVIVDSNGKTLGIYEMPDRDGVIKVK